VLSLKLQAIAARAAKGKGISSPCNCLDPSVIREVGIKQFSTFHDRPVIMLAPAAGKKLRAAQHGMLMATGAYWGSIRAAAQPLFHAARRDFDMPRSKARATPHAGLSMWLGTNNSLLTELLQTGPVDS